jgi:hypothetical protein
MIKVVSAYYGPVGNVKDRIDVTQKLNELISADKKTLALIVSPTNLGVTDPSPGNPKELDIKYTVNNEERKELVRDSSSLLIKAGDITHRTWAGFAVSSFAGAWRGMLIVVCVFLYVMSIAFASQLGRTLFNPILWIVIALMFPYVSFWGIPIVVILMRIFSSQDFIVI